MNAELYLALTNKLITAMLIAYIVSLAHLVFLVCYFWRSTLIEPEPTQKDTLGYSESNDSDPELEAFVQNVWVNSDVPVKNCNCSVCEKAHDKLEAPLTPKVEATEDCSTVYDPTPRRSDLTYLTRISPLYTGESYEGQMLSKVICRTCGYPTIEPEIFICTCRKDVCPNCCGNTVGLHEICRQLADGELDPLIDRKAMHIGMKVIRDNLNVTDTTDKFNSQVERGMYGTTDAVSDWSTGDDIRQLATELNQSRVTD